MKQHHNMLSFLAFAIFMVLICPVLAQNVIYVDDDVTLGGDGASWNTAYKYLQDALVHVNDLAPEPVEVRVAQGTYKPDRSAANPAGTGDREASFHLAGHMSLRGGYLGHKFAGLNMPDPNVQDPDLYPTILSGDLAGNDVDVNDLSMLMDEPTRSENSLHVMVVSGWQPPIDEIFAQEDIWANANVVEGITITGGHALGEIWGDDDLKRGGGILLTSGYSNIKDCLFEANVAVGGAGLNLCDTSKMRMKSCRFFRNAADGGGIYCRGDYLKGGAQVELMSCEFSQNWATSSGGGLIVYGSKVILIRCKLTNNIAIQIAGGGLASSQGYVELIGTIIRGNITGGSGGGIFCHSVSNLDRFGRLVLSGCDLIENYAEGSIFLDGGGAIGVLGIRSVELFNCLFAGNRTSGYGGVLSSQGSLISIVNCTAHGNRAYSGSFLNSFSYTGPKQSITFIENCIIDNGGKEFSLGGAVPEPFNSLIEIRYTDLPDVNIPTTDNHETGFLWGAGNLSVDPCFVAPGYWEANGTPSDPNDDVFILGDYHLKSQTGRWDPVTETWLNDDVTSPAVDAGDPLALLRDEVFPHGDRINMGAYGGTMEASLSHTIGLSTTEPNVPEPPVDPNEGGNTGGGGGR